MEETREIITGTVKNIVFRSADTGWTVLDLEIDGYCDTVVGKLQGISVGDVVEITGRYVVHETYGQQFKADYYVKTLPTGTAAIMRYLSSGVIKGIGHATAKRIVQCFGLSNGIELQIREKVQFMADLGLRQEPEICMKWLRDISGDVE